MTMPGDRNDTLRSTLKRARRGAGLTPYTADRLAVEWLGVHPSAVWAEWFTL